ncbi:MAG: polysaccharide deacetylase family protein [Chloroflexia bacterium]
MNPKISVVIPTRNRRDLLLKTLAHLAEQTAPGSSYEVIVVSDGSTDGTFEALRNLAVTTTWAGGPALYCIEQVWSGASAARNRGMREAKSEYVLLLDDDMEADHAVVQAHLDAHAREQGISVVLGNIIIPAAHAALPFQLRRAFMSRDKRLLQEEPEFKDLYTGNVSFPKREALMSGGFDESIRYAEDVEFGARLARAGLKFVYAPEAKSVHCDPKPAYALLDDFSRSGVGCVQTWRKHPDLLKALPLSSYGETSLRLRLARRMLLGLSELAPVARVLEWLCARWAASHLTGAPSRAVFELTRSYYFWRGVRSIVDRREWKRLTDPGAVVLMYHSVSRHGAKQRFTISPRRFGMQLKMLRLLGRRVLTLNRCIELWAAGKMTPPRTVVITFDDGYKNLLHEAVPVLRKYRFPATLFVVAGKVGSINDWEGPGELRKPLLSWNELSFMEYLGLSVESHGLQHIRLTSATPEAARRDMEESRKLISASLGKWVRIIAYPYGSSNGEVEDGALAAGYAAAVTVRQGMNTLRTPRYALKRTEISGNESMPMFLLKVLLGEDPFKWLRPKGKGLSR